MMGLGDLISNCLEDKGMLSFDYILKFVLANLSQDGSVTWKII